MKEVNREHLMDLINDGLDYDEIMDALNRMQDEEEAEENDAIVLEDAMYEAAYALADFIFKGMSMYGLVEDGLTEEILRDNIEKALKEVTESLQRAGKFKADLTKLDEKVRTKGEPTEEDLESLKKLMGALFK